MLNILIWWIVVEIGGLMVLPLILQAFKEEPDRGYPLSRITGWLLMGVFSWNLGYWKIIPNTQWSLIWMGAALGIFSWFYSSKWRQDALDFILNRSDIIFFYELIGLLSFIGYLIFRAQIPVIYGAEKFMDFSIFNSILRSNTLPPTDPWMAGLNIHYYYFGHYIYAIIDKITGIPSNYGYNLALGTVFFLSCMLCAWLASQLGIIQIKEENPGKFYKGKILPALFVILMVLIAGNMDGFVQLLEKGLSQGIDYWRSSRVIPNTITEFPFFSFIHGDLHAHLMNLPTILLFLAVLYSLSKNIKSPLLIIFMAITLSALVAINSWDALPALLLLWGWAFFPINGRKLATAALISLGALLLMGSYYLQLPRSVGGIGRVTDSTTLLQWLTVIAFPFCLILFLEMRILLRDIHKQKGSQGVIFILNGWVFSCFVLGILLNSLAGGISLVTAIISLYLAGKFRDSRQDYFAWLMAGIGFLLLTLPEIIFFKDPFAGNEFYRMNTVFKLYFSGWVLISLAAGTLTIKKWKEYNEYLLGGITGLFAAAMVYPVWIVLMAGFHSPAHWTLDGTAYLEMTHPDELKAIQWINQNIKGTPAILEYGTEAYTYSARVSSNTGLPTVLGWSNHELVWRDDSRLIENRLGDLSQLWTSQDKIMIDSLVKKYGIQYVFWGDMENLNLPLDAKTKWRERGTVVFNSGTVEVIELKKP